MNNQALSDDERARLITIAEAIINLEQAEGWQHLVGTAESLINAHMPNIASFTPEQATEIASRMAFITGIKRTLGLIDQQKEILRSLSK